MASQPTHLACLPASSGGDHQLNLKVIFTDLPSTAAALAAAGSMARGLGARITIIAAQVVPYPLPLGNPPVPVEFTERLLESIAWEQESETAVEIHLCRDKYQTIRRALGPASLAVIGARKRWWASGAQRLARMLRRDGHRVLLVNI